MPMASVSTVAADENTSGRRKASIAASLVVSTWPMPSRLSDRRGGAQRAVHLLRVAVGLGIGGEELDAFSSCRF